MLSVKMILYLLPPPITIIKSGLDCFINKSVALLSFSEKALAPT